MYVYISFLKEYLKVCERKRGRRRIDFVGEYMKHKCAGTDFFVCMYVRVCMCVLEDIHIEYVYETWE